VVRRVGRLIGKRSVVVPAPAAFDYVVAKLAEWLMTIPLASLAKVRILQEGLVEPWGSIDPLPADLVPLTPLSDEVLRAGLPPAGPFTWADLHGLKRPSRFQRQRDGVQ
jgi:NADH dehydrogenase